MTNTSVTFPLNISRKPLETPMCKGFEGREMLLKHIPYISRRYPVHLTHKYPLSFPTTEETEKKRKCGNQWRWL